MDNKTANNEVMVEDLANALQIAVKWMEEYAEDLEIEYVPDIMIDDINDFHKLIANAKNY